MTSHDETNPIASGGFRMTKDFGDWSADLAIPQRFGGYGVAVIIDGDGLSSDAWSCFD